MANLGEVTKLLKKYSLMRNFSKSRLWNSEKCSSWYVRTKTKYIKIVYSSRFVRTQIYEKYQLFFAKRDKSRACKARPAPRPWFGGCQRGQARPNRARRCSQLRAGGMDAIPRVQLARTNKKANFLGALSRKKGRSPLSAKRKANLTRKVSCFRTSWDV